MTVTKQTILGIQYLRGLAALGVVCCHYGSYIEGLPWLAKIFNWGQNGVPVFFLVSGFIINYSLNKANYRYADFFRFLARRSIRIDPPYFLIIFLMLALFIALSYKSPFIADKFQFSLPQLLANMFYVVPFTHYKFYNHIFWTLSIEFQFYLLIGLLYYLSPRRLYQTVFLIVFCLSAFFNYPNADLIVFSYGPVFALGMSLIRFYEDRKWQRLVIPGFILLLIAYKYGLPLLMLLAACCALIFIITKPFKPLFFLGQISYSLYLTHVFILTVLTLMLKKVHLYQWVFTLSGILLQVMLAIAVAYVYYTVIERPAIKLSQKFFYKSKLNSSAHHTH